MTVSRKTLKRLEKEARKRNKPPISIIFKEYETGRSDFDGRVYSSIEEFKKEEGIEDKTVFIHQIYSTLEEFYKKHGKMLHIKKQ